MERFFVLVSGVGDEILPRLRHVEGPWFALGGLLSDIRSAASRERDNRPDGLDRDALLNADALALEVLLDVLDGPPSYIQSLRNLANTAAAEPKAYAAISESSDRMSRAIKSLLGILASGMGMGKEPESR